MGLIALVLIAATVIFVGSWQLLQRGLVRPAALLLTGTLLVVPILLAAAEPLFASFPLVPLLGVAFAMPFLEGRRLAILMGLACVSAGRHRGDRVDPCAGISPSDAGPSSASTCSACWPSSSCS